MRIGLVLGAGGVLGSAWATGVLPALAARLDRPLGQLDLVLGTSAGSVLGAALRCGMDLDELLAHQRGERSGEDTAEEPGADAESGGALPWWPPAGWFPASGSLPGWTLPGWTLPDWSLPGWTLPRWSLPGRSLPEWPRPGIGSPRMLLAAAGQPMRINPVIAASALLPVGRSRMGELVRVVGVMQRRLGVTADGWVPGPPLWVVAVDYDAGRRVVFGRAGGPPTSVAEAVLASCAIPGWFAPQVINGTRYVDGGVASSTSVGLLARRGAPRLDLVYVLAPMAGHELDRSRDPVIRMERGMRRLLTRWLDAEVRALRATGTRVVVVTPGPTELRAMGGNLMNPERRLAVLDAALTSAPAALDRAAAASAAAA